MKRSRIETTLQLPGEAVRLGERPIIMGILNVTPDSFSDGGQFDRPELAFEQGMKLARDGADWLDVGGESTRPGAEPVSLVEELKRVLPIVEYLRAQTDRPISIDTYKPEVASRAVAAGASIINDVTGFRDPAMLDVAAGCHAACVCMHMRGTPQTMMKLAEYTDIVAELNDYFAERLETMVSAGISRDRIILDPGIGFAKRTQHNLAILQNLDQLAIHGRPILLGASRKRIIGDLTGRAESDRLPGTIATTIVGWLDGVHAFRVHDVSAIRDALAVISVLER
jgi:dihydropteroate synthase